MAQTDRRAPAALPRSALTGNQIRGFWAAWGGWALDGMDSFIYALIMVPALRELLPRSAIANYFVGSHFGWRAMFAVGGAPALLIAFIRFGVTEPRRWTSKLDQIRSLTMYSALAELFSPQFRRRTILNCLYVLVSIVGLWAGSVYVPAAVISLATRAGYAVAYGNRLASYATMLLAVATIIGCVVLPPMAEKWGRRATLGIYFAVMLVSIPLTFGYAFYMPVNALPWFMACLFLIGFGGGNFAMYTLWLPEQYPTECRASAFALATSVGRFAGAGITFLVGAGVSHFHTVGTPVALTGLAFGIGLLLLPFGEETRGKPLPA